MNSDLKNLEEGFLSILSRENKDIPFINLKKSFHKFGKKVDKETLEKVVNDARENGDFGILVNKKVN